MAVLDAYFRAVAIAEIRSKAGPVTVEELRMSFARDIPGLIGMIACHLKASPAEVKALAVAGELTFEQLRGAVGERGQL